MITFYNHHTIIQKELFYFKTNLEDFAKIRLQPQILLGTKCQGVTITFGLKDHPPTHKVGSCCSLLLFPIKTFHIINKLKHIYSVVYIQSIIMCLGIIALKISYLVFLGNIISEECFFFFLFTRSYFNEFFIASYLRT